MSVEFANPAELPEPLGAYSHVASARGRLVAIAGQVGSQRDGSVDDDCRAQVIQTFENVRLALASEGLTPSDILQLTTYLVSADDIPAFFEARAQAFESLFPDGTYPPNTLLIISRLVHPELRVEISALGVAPG